MIKISHYIVYESSTSSVFDVNMRAPTNTQTEDRGMRRVVISEKWANLLFSVVIIMITSVYI